MNKYLFLIFVTLFLKFIPEKLIKLACSYLFRHQYDNSKKLHDEKRNKDGETDQIKIDKEFTGDGVWKDGLRPGDIHKYFPGIYTDKSPPKEAKYCDVFGFGGDKFKFGIVSGQVIAVGSLLCFFTLLFVKDAQATNRNLTSKETVLISFLGILLIAVMTARYGLNCHTIQQVIFGGIAIGAAWDFQQLM